MDTDYPTSWPDKFPEERLDYYYDWAPALDLANSETRASLTISGSNPDLVIETPTYIGNVMKVWISGGSAPDSGNFVKMSLTTSTGRVIGRNVSLKLKDR